MEKKYYNRNTTIRMALARGHVQSKLRDEHPEILYDHESKQRFVISTEGAGIVDESAPPCGIVFTDGSFLTIYEEWSKPDDEILSYSYHYQRGKVSVRYDMDEKPREGIPRWHMQFSGMAKVHAPCGGRVSIEQVLDMIVQQFMT